MAYSDKQWELVRSYYEAGLSLSEIVSRDKVEIKSKSQISKRAKLEEWVKSKNEQLIQKEVLANQEINSIKKQKETLKETDNSVINEIVDERTKHLLYFQNSAMRNQQIANELLDERAKSKGEDGLSFIMLDAHSKTTLRNKETVLGKQPDTAIQINNTVPPPTTIKIVGPSE